MSFDWKWNKPTEDRETGFFPVSIKGIEIVNPHKIFPLLVRRRPYRWYEYLILKPLWEKYYIRWRFK